MFRLSAVPVAVVVRLFRLVDGLAVVAFLVGFAAVGLKQRVLKAALVL